jgi:rhomboid protease GluP
VIFLIISVAYALTLLLIKPAPSSLKVQPLTFSENFHQVKAAFIFGELLLVIFFFTSDFKFININEQIFEYYSLPSNLYLSKNWLLQSVTHLFLHINFIHVISNVSALGLLSMYERRVGSKRFLIVLAVSSIASIPSALFYTNSSMVCGISGGIFGLAAAYFTDQKEITTKEWLQAILAFVVIAVVLAFVDEFKTSNINHHFQVDYIGHALGAVGGIIYCRFRPN